MSDQLDLAAFGIGFGLVWVFFPWVLGLTDVISWMLTGNRLTSVPWSGARGLVMMIWPLCWAFVILMCTSAAG